MLAIRLAIDDMTVSYHQQLAILCPYSKMSICLSSTKQIDTVVNIEAFILCSEVDYLSPYLLPVPLTTDALNI